MTLDKLIDEYKTLPKICASTNYADKKSVKENNKAVDRMYEIVSLVNDFGQEGTKMFSLLLDISDNKTNIWAATHLLEKLPFDESKGRLALQIIEKVANGDDLTATGYQMWLKEYELKNSSMTAQHVLNIYRTRLKMLEDGITNPAQEFKDIARTIIEKLSKMSPDEKIIWDNHMMKDSKGNFIVKFPKGQNHNLSE